MTENNKLKWSDQVQSNQARSEFVNWFRDSAPYIHAHRQRTFVIFFGGEAVKDHHFAKHVHDFALLNSLGIQLVLVHGIRPQINARLSLQQKSSQFVNQLRITDDATLQLVKEAAGAVRVEIEALLSMGLANSPMAGAKICVVSGNFITAKPIGVLNGIDFIHTGKIRRLNHHSIKQQLALNNVLLLSPVGYSPSGEAFNLCAEDVATEIAIALQAEKLILLTEQDITAEHSLLAQLTCSEAESLLQENTALTQAAEKSLVSGIRACKNGVERVHLINRNHDGALLLELFSRDGIGTLISANPFEELRPANINDIPGILELITPLEQQEKLLKRSREHLEIEIADYLIIERDGLIIACIALHYFSDCRSGEIACLAVHPEYRRQMRGQQLLAKATELARQQGFRQLFALSTQTMHWFIEQGYQVSDKSHLPDPLLSNYNLTRNSKILLKKINDLA